MQQNARERFSELPRWARRLILATFLFLDANLLGTLNGFGSLNLLDRILGGGLPNDMVWILQVVQSISAGFIVVKILFDDAPEGIPRTIGLILSPLFIVVLTFLPLDFLMRGLEVSASFTLDSVSIATGTLTWSSTYLAIAIGLTLTYLQGTEIRKLRPIRTLHAGHVPSSSLGLDRPTIPDVQSPNFQGRSTNLVCPDFHPDRRIHPHRARWHHHRQARLPWIPKERGKPPGNDDRISWCGTNPPGLNLPSVWSR